MQQQFSIICLGHSAWAVLKDHSVKFTGTFAQCYDWVRGH